MKTYTIINLLVLVVLLGSCRKADPVLDSCPDFELQLASSLEDDDRAIFNLIIDSFGPDRFPRVLQKAGSETQVEWVHPYMDRFTTVVDSAVVVNYVVRNQSPIYLPNEFQAPIITRRDLDCLQQINSSASSVEDFWANFYNKYPDSRGYLKLELPGYNATKTMALVEFGVFYASLGAEGFIMVLEKVNGVWTIAERHLTWIS